MQDGDNNNQSIWKKFERISGVIALFAAITVIIGFYYQFHTKNTEVKFQIISKDYLTSNNNVDRLKSNYVYAGIPVKHLWLLKIKVINTGDVTLIGRGINTSLLDSNLVFKFPQTIQILNQPLLINNSFPDHQLTRLDSNKLSLSFQQWRSGEYVVYSIYVKSDKKVNSFVPSSPRMIKDGNIFIEDLTNDQAKEKIPLLDKLFISPWSLILRGLGIILGLSVIGVICVGLYVELTSWYKVLKWKSQYYQKYKGYLMDSSFTNLDSNFNPNFSKQEFASNKNFYIKRPTKLVANVSLWKNIGIPAVPYDNAFIFSWKSFFLFILVSFTIFSGGWAIILGLWLN